MSKKKRNGNVNGNGNSNGKEAEVVKKGKTKTRIAITAKSENQKALLKSIKENLVTIVAGPPGSGKAQPLDSRVYTPDGYKLMKDVNIGDKVSTPDGSISNVVGVFPQGKKDVYRIFFVDGGYVECCKDHLWRIKDKYRYKEKYKNKYRVEDTSFLINKLNNKTKTRRFSIDTPKNCFFYKRDILINPYLMGCLIGDGGISKTVIFSSSDDEILCEIGGMVSKDGCKLKHYGQYDYGISALKRGQKNHILESLRLYGLHGKKSIDKFIPDDYLYNSFENRLSLLQGLMDTDGTVSRKSGMPSFCTISYQLALDMKDLVQSIGGICVIKDKKSFYTDKNGKKVMGNRSYICHIRYNKNKDIFRLNRKKEIAKNRTKYFTKRTIERIEKIGVKKCKCILIDSEDHLYLTDNFVVTHNTKLAVVSGLREFIMGKYKKMIFTRPCVEANHENLGFLPGDLNEKISPYMYPIFDFLSDYLSPKQIEEYMKEEEIKTFPLAFMRGCAQPLDSKVLTPSGFKDMGYIKIGDEIISENGDKIKVDGVYPQGEIDVFKIIFSDGSYTKCCINHLWNTKTLNDIRYNKDFSIRDTNEIMRTLKSGVNFNHRIPILSSPVEFKESHIPVDPYLLGALLGDGSLHETSSIKITTADEDMIEHIEKNMLEGMEVKYASKYDYRIVYNKNSGIGNPLKKSIKDLGLLGSKSLNKFVPDIYKINSTHIRLEVLRGLLDTDGCIFSQEGRNDRIQYYSISEQLAQDVLFIVQSLGGVGTIRKRETDKEKASVIGEHKFYAKNDIYVVEIKLPENINPFKISRKHMKYNPKNMTKNRINRIVKEIIPIGKQVCQCISVDSDSELYITDDFIVTHNTFRNSFVILDEAQNTSPEQVRMFLTRIGENCKIVITGDPLQTDVRGKNGLVDACERLEGVKNLSIIKFTNEDIVRNPIVAEIEDRYSEEK